MSTPIRTIGSISEQIRGVSYAKADASDVKLDGYLPILRAGNITEFGLTFDDLVFVPSKKVSNNQKIRKNDIVIAASSGSLSVVGKAARTIDDFEGGFGAFCKVLRPNSEVDSSYFAHYFLTPAYRRKISSLAAGANINNLRNNDIDDLQIPLPPLPEQKRIAAILDAADALRTQRRQSIAELDLLLQSTFLEMFGDPVENTKGWEKEKLGSLIVHGPQNGLYKHAKDYGRGTRILRIDGFYNGKVLSEENLKRLQASEKEIETYKLNHNDIVINRVNSREYLGKSALIPKFNEYILFESNMMRMTLDKEKIVPRFAINFLQTGFIKNQILNRAKDAVNQSSINQKDVCDFDILIPPLKIQKEFAEIVEAIEAQKTRLQAHLVELDTLFASLQQRAFNGEL